MLFIQPTSPLPLRGLTANPQSCGQRQQHVVMLSASKGGRGFRRAFQPAGDDAPSNFEPYDGSMPLLPAWRPSSLEQAFDYAASRVSHRERDMEEPAKVVRVVTTDHATMFASVVQEVEGSPHRPARVWLRPLLLDAADGFVDLRGVSDVVLDFKFVCDDVDQRTRTSVHVNLAATESDLSARIIADDPASGVASDALVNFLRRLHAPPSESSHPQVE